MESSALWLHRVSVIWIKSTITGKGVFFLSPFFFPLQAQISDFSGFTLLLLLLNKQNRT